jgi:hypothetical protein
MMTQSLTNSDGSILNGPIRIQLCAPPATCPKRERVSNRNIEPKTINPSILLFFMALYGKNAVSINKKRLQSKKAFAFDKNYHLKLHIFE